MCRVKSYKANYRQHSVDTSDYIMEQYSIKSSTGERKNTLMQKSKQTNKQTK
jgi:hypothetical protein